MVFSKESLIESGKIKAEIDIEIPTTDENGKYTKVKDTLLVTPITNVQADRLNKTHKDDANALGRAIIFEATEIKPA